MTLKTKMAKLQFHCTEEWPEEWEWSRPIYGAFINISQFVLPFTTILFCYRSVHNLLATFALLHIGNTG